MTEQVLDSDGVRITWDESGAGAPLLLVMGHRWSRRMWHPVRDCLSQRFRVIAFDNRGSGTSGTPAGPYPLAHMTEDAVRVLDAAGVERAHVFGVSMGGVIAQDLVLTHPERVDHLVLGCTAPLVGNRLRLSWARRLNYYLPDRVVNAVSRSLLYGTWATTPAIRKDLEVLAGERTSRAGLLGQAMAVSGYHVDVDGLRAVSRPTLVLHGAKDKVVKPAWGRELAELLPDAELHVFETAGHNFLPTHAGEVCDRVSAFLEPQPAP